MRSFAVWMVALFLTGIFAAPCQSAVPFSQTEGLSPYRVLQWGLLAGGGALAVLLLVLAANRRLKREVAERLRAEAALKENENRFRQLTDHIEEVFWIVSPGWETVIYISPAYEKIWGRTCRSLYDHPESWRNAIVDADQNTVSDYLSKKTRGDLEEIIFPEYRIQRPDGSIRWIRARGFPVSDDNGKILRIVGIAEDITLRREAETRQQEHLFFLENLERLDRVVRQATDLDQMMQNVLEAMLGIFGADRAWLLYPCNPQASLWRVPMECTRPEYPGAFARNSEIPMYAELMAISRDCLETDRPVASDLRTGRDLPPEIAQRFSILSQLVMAVHPKIGEPWMLGMHQCSHERVWTDQDISLFQEAGRRIADALSSMLFLKDLRESEANFRQLYETSKREEEINRGLLASSADAIVQYDMAGKVIFVNPIFTDLFGWTLEEVAGERLDFIPETEREASLKIVRDLIENGTPCSGFESRRTTKDGDILTVSISGSRYHDHLGNPAGMLSIIRDISETKRLESQFQQSQRLEAIGTLAGGIAHDFNNLLMGIQGRCSLMMANADPRGEDFEHLQGIESHVKSAADLTRQLLGFARGGRYEVKSTDLNELIKVQNRMFGRTRKEITIRGKYEKGLWPVEVDRGQFRQMLLNFYVNAWHAMPGGGNLFVYTENVALSAHDALMHGAAAGRYAKIIITDTGVGMDRETQQRIFEPFFTTREMGRGTGLGLASAYGIIKNHKGFITVYSEKGGGTTFNIYLPASMKNVVDDPAESSVATRGHGQLLLVDDETMILDVARQMLERLGYEVVTAASGDEALAVYAEKGKGIDLVILDMIMPEMGGSETFDRLKAMDAGVRVLLSSGYSVDGQASEILDRGCMGFIQKPFNLEQLSKKIHEALKGGSD
ncbi:MAG: PAS domain S-box protein [Desulfobacterales bacterium]|nr:PAS domain S-box protein [Desulfobacterales bacterium]